jgi:hypothetical protein
MKLIGYPESKLEPQKIVAYVSKEMLEKGEFIAHVYSDGSVGMGIHLVTDRDLNAVILIRDNFFLFYDNIENVNTL